MHFVAISIAIQILCAVHCVRGGRNSMWLMVIIFLSIPGCLAYAFFEILPDFAGRREVRAAKAAAIRTLDPERQLRAAWDALDIVDTAANRTSLGDALAESGAWKEAASHYQAALAKLPLADRATQVKLARAQLEAGHSLAARKLLEGLPDSGSQSENDRTRLILARSLEACGETEQAMQIFADVGTRLPGSEAQCRLAALLISEGRKAEALPVLTEVERRVKRLSRLDRASEAEMYDWAERTLAELRAT
jgi:hypothetical protein